MSPQTDSQCVFCKIIAGELPAVRVYEDDEVIAFMDIGPVVKGHTLVVPKEHCDPITRTPPHLLEKLILVVQRIAQAQVSGLGAAGINVTQANGRLAGQIIPHIHFHVIPRYESDGHHWNWIPGKYANEEEMQNYARRIADAL
jgi:histidine triad (HIT) family protein